MMCWRRAFLFVAVGLLGSNAHSLCIDEAKDLDSCLQCCTDTAQTAQVIGGNVKLAADLAALCDPNHQKVDSKQLKEFYAKYKIEGAVYFTACANPKFVKDGQFKAEPYNECVKACENKFKGKNQ